MGKVFLLPWELILFLSFFELLALYPRIFWNKLIQPSGLSSLNSGTGTVPVLCGRGQIGSNWEKKRRPPPFTHLAVLIYLLPLCYIFLEISFRNYTQGTHKIDVQLSERFQGQHSALTQHKHGYSAQLYLSLSWIVISLTHHGPRQSRQYWVM